MSRRSLSAELVRRARMRGDCSTSQLAVLSGRSDRAVRHDLVTAESRPEQLLRLHARSATPAERVAIVQDVAELLGADVVVLPSAAAAAVEVLAATLPHRRAA